MQLAVAVGATSSVACIDSKPWTIGDDLGGRQAVKSTRAQLRFPLGRRRQRRRVVEGTEVPARGHRPLGGLESHHASRRRRRRR